MSEIKYINPSNLGWLEYNLGSDELNYLWERVESSNESHKHKLVADIHESNILEDPDDWFFNNTVLKLCHAYKEIYENVGSNLPISRGNYPYYMREWWVNFQHQNEFNPSHDHTGVYSFVIWLQIPTEHKEQNKDNPCNIKLTSSFQFAYTDLVGKIRNTSYDLDKSWEGTMLFFPSKLVHQVYPFYNNDGTRISISGNVLCKT